jgi:hypothetical protein
VVLGLLAPGLRQEPAEADLGTPGGISALPSAAPGIPGVMNQAIPAIIRARQPGNVALVTVFCDPRAEAPAAAFVGQHCAFADDDVSGPITFKISRIYPPEGEPASTFPATGTTEMTCLTGPIYVSSSGGGPCDYSSKLGVVVVQVNGGGANEVVRVTATDAAGESRAVDIVVVDTILAWGPTGALSTAAQNEPAFISYACDAIGNQLVDLAGDPQHLPGPLPWDGSLAAYAESFADDDGALGLDDLWELEYNTGSGLNFGPLDNTGRLEGTTPNLFRDVDVPLWWCGGDTASPADDFVDFHTDLGILSVDPKAVDIMENIPNLQAAYGITMPPSLDFDCGEGKDINTADVDSLSVWGAVKLDERTEGGCDADFARNGVVTTMILGNGEVGVATITAQQGGGVSPPRTINLTFAGEASLSLFMQVPETIGTEGGKFEVMVVDQDGRPVGGETVECTVEPTEGALAVIPQTGTTSSVHSESPGSLSMALVPTGASVVAGGKLTLTCVLDRDRSISATATIPLSTVPGQETVDLPAGCLLLGSTWQDGSDIATVAGAVTPAKGLVAVWAFDPATGAWVGFSPSAPAGVNDLRSVDRLEPLFVCMSEPGVVARPVL